MFKPRTQCACNIDIDGHLVSVGLLIEQYHIDRVWRKVLIICFDTAECVHIDSGSTYRDVRHPDNFTHPTQFRLAAIRYVHLFPRRFWSVNIYCTPYGLRILFV